MAQDTDPVIRQRDWRTRLVAWAETQKGKPFEWGSTDCAALARAALIEMFGPALIPHLPEWHNVRGAAGILQAQGPVGCILEKLGAERTSVPFMRAGDIVVSADPEEKVGRVSVLVCIDGQQCLCGTHHGVVMMTPDLGSAVYSLWKVPLG